MQAAYPHDGVYARLGVSRIHGVGVIAIRPIPSGTNIFANDTADIRWVNKIDIDRMGIGDELKKLYKDFCILKDGKYGVPTSFNVITPGWYLNEPLPGEQPNVALDDEYNLIAQREIEVGEELTLVYATFSDPIERY